MSIFAADTSTPVERTRVELETVLGKFGVDGFGYATEAGRASVNFRAHGKFIRFILPLPPPSDKRFTQYTCRGKTFARTGDSARKEWEQACRSAWRALFLCVKAKLVAVDAKISTFEEEFMAHIVLPDGRTVSECALPLIERSYKDGQMPDFLALPPRRTE